MLSTETIIRTPNGDRAIASLSATDQIYDQSNQIINVSVGPPTPLEDAHRVVFHPFHASHNGLHEEESITHIVIDAQHRLHLVVPKYSAAILARDKKEPDLLTIVNWHTFCIEYTTPEAQARAELAELEWPAVPPPPATYLRPRATLAETATASEALRSSPAAAPFSDPSYAPSSDVDEYFDVAEYAGVHNENGGIIDDQTDDERSDEDEPMQPAPSSDAFLQYDNHSHFPVNQAQRRLADDEACQCGTSRQFSLRCGNEAQARLLRMALRTPELAWRVDPKALLPGDPHTVPLPRFMASPHVKNPDRGGPPEGAFLKLARFPFETLSIKGTAGDSLPIEPLWLGLCLGDGYHAGTIVSSSDFDEMRDNLASYVDRLIAVRPAGAAPLHLHSYAQTHPEDYDGLHISVTVFNFSINSTYFKHPYIGFFWTPIRNGFRALGILNNHKERGVPESYMNASQEASLMVTDVSLVSNTSYEISQSVKHERLLHDI